MDKLHGFVELTSVYDGRKGMINAEEVLAVLDNAAETESFNGDVVETFPEHRLVVFNGGSFEATESYEEILELLYMAKL